VQCETIETIVETPLYVLRRERWRMGDEEEWTQTETAYTPSGDYIGDGEWSRLLCDQHGIAPQKRCLESSVCSIGFSEKEQRWYGWSHRAVCGFGIGDVVDSPEHLCATSGWVDGIDPTTGKPDENPLPVGFEAKTIEDAKRMAIAFAESVN